MYTRQNIADLLKISVGTVRLWRLCGFLPPPTKSERPERWSAETVRKFCKEKRMVYAYV